MEKEEEEMIPILILLLFNLFHRRLSIYAFVFRYRGMLAQGLCAVIWLLIVITWNRSE